MSIKNYCILLFCKLTLYLSNTLKLGAGSTWPGHIALFLNGNFIKETLPQNVKTVLIAGTNGKTTTATIISYILEKSGRGVFQNEEGANLLNGIASSIIKNYGVSGKLKADIAIFEVDENALPQALSHTAPSAVVILNLFRDQLDRYGEVNTIAQNWALSLKNLPPRTKVILNADDPRIKFLGTDLKASLIPFGAAGAYMTLKELSHDADSTYCPRCQKELTYHKIAYSHLGDYECTSCGFRRGEAETFKDKSLVYPLLGTYNVYNTNAAITVAERIFSIPLSKIKIALSSFKPAFGRQEIIQYKGKEVLILLSKNPTGFNQSIEIVRNELATSRTLLIVLNDRIPDGRDVSWIWDVEFEKLFAIKKIKNIVVSGDRTYDMGLRLAYTQEKEPSFSEDAGTISFNSVEAIPDLKQAVATAIDASRKSEKLIVMATYSAMLETRKILHGRKLK